MTASATRRRRRDRKRPKARQPKAWLSPVITNVKGPLKSVVLVGAEGEADLTRSVSAAGLTASMGAVSTVSLTVVDPDRELLRPLLDRDEDLLLDDNLDVEIHGTTYRLMGIQPSDRGWTLALEDRAGSWLRRHSKQISAVRGRVTRAQFIHRLHREAGGGIPLYAPELRDKQRILKSTSPTADAKDEAPRTKATSGVASGGWPSGTKPKVKHATANGAQLRIIAAILGECVAQKCSPRVMAAALMAATQESTMGKDIATTGNDDAGLFQQGRNWISLANIKDPAKCTRAFLLGGKGAKVGGTGAPGWKQIHGSLRNGKGNLSTMIAMVQQPRRDLWGEYGNWESEAKQAVDLFTKNGGGGAASESSSPGTPSAAAYVFERGQDGKREDSLLCAIRLAEEVGWRYWVYAGAAVFASDDELIGAPVGLRIDRYDDATIDGPNWTWDQRKPASDCTVNVVVERLPEPGQVVQLTDDEGPAQGLWLLQSIECDLALPVDLADGSQGLNATLTLIRPTAEKREPAADTASAEGSGDDGEDAASSGKLRRKGNRVFGGSARERLVFAAQEAARLDKSGARKSFYSQTGAFSASLGITGEKRGMRSDCSSWVTAMYHSAGLPDPNGLGYKGGYTGSLAANAKKVSRGLPGDLAMYGSGTFHHVELYVGNGKTIGHGDRFVDYATPRGIGAFAGFYRPNVLKGK